MLDAGVEADRELLLAAMRWHLDTLPTEVLVELTAAADELVDPAELPVLVSVPAGVQADLIGVIRAVRERLAAVAGDAAGSPGQAMACARAARHLRSAERELGAAPAL